MNKQIAEAFLFELLEQVKISPAKFTNDLSSIAFLHVLALNDFIQNCATIVFDYCGTDSETSEKFLKGFEENLNRATPDNIFQLLSKTVDICLKEKQWTEQTKKFIKFSVEAGMLMKSKTFLPLLQSYILSLMERSALPRTDNGLQAAIRLLFTSAKPEIEMNYFINELIDGIKWENLISLSASPFCAENFRKQDRFDFWWDDFFCAFSSKLQHPFSLCLFLVFSSFNKDSLRA